MHVFLMTLLGVALITGGFAAARAVTAPEQQYIITWTIAYTYLALGVGCLWIVVRWVRRW